MAEPSNRILVKMLDRLFASLTSGPSLNCRPHASRQRIDLTALARLGDISPEEVLRRLLSAERGAKITARVPSATAQRRADGVWADARQRGEVTAEQAAAEEAFASQQAVLSKLRVMAEDARIYEQDTGVYVLNMGFPLLSIPAGVSGSQRSAVARRIIAPLAFMPVSLTVRGGPKASVEVGCKGEGIDLVKPNMALLAWLERQTGKAAAELFGDEEGNEPWREIGEVVKQVCTMLELPVPALFEAEKRSDGARPTADAPAALELEPAPRADNGQAQPAIFLSAVLGLFPVANQGLLRDMQAMVDGQGVSGPIESFIRPDADVDQAARGGTDSASPQAAKQARVFGLERFVTPADPCQSRAVKLSRHCKGMVIHGPPGTGKSQTITNIIADHLARGQRVLMVCDKRTALDVVANRMEHLGLGRWCALVHDPQRDQRELYRSIRDQLDGLAEAVTDDQAEKRLGKLDADLQNLHEELTQYYSALMNPKGDGAASFHELVGQWLSLPSAEGIRFDEQPLQGVTLEQAEQSAPIAQDILQRGLDVGYTGNPWVSAAGLKLAGFLASPMGALRAAARACVEAAVNADATADPAIPPFAAGVGLSQQGQARVGLADDLSAATAKLPREIVARWAGQSASAIGRVQQRLSEMQGALEVLRSGPLDAELSLVARSEAPGIAVVVQQLSAIEAYLGVAGKWYAFMCFKRKSRALSAAARYGLPLDVGSAERLRGFLTGLRARLLLQGLHNEVLWPAPVSGLPADDALDASISQHWAAVALLHRAYSNAALAGLGETVGKALVDPLAAGALIGGLRASTVRAAALADLEEAVAGARGFDARWLSTFSAAVRGGKGAAEAMSLLSDRIDTLEGVLRIREELQSIAGSLRGSLLQLLDQGVAPEHGLKLIRRAVIAGEIGRRLRIDPALQAIDAQKLKSSFDRYRRLDAEKKEVVRSAIVHQWTARQKERLLAATGSRLNSVGGDLRRRLISRGERALRLRQVVAIGRNIEGGDPLFDLRPVWMASPETVAQIFPRAAVFDVVVFDEASQCRLEEALPVLLRAERVVIAGDPKQLPPSRFFESAVAASDDEEIESDQQLFEMQQGEIEDLLAAALNLSLDQSYLDVHYRSRNADLIGFSNEHFYASRLQAIPAHPSTRTRYPPLRIHRADGVYEKQTNAAEAEMVCEIVRELLNGESPPSIGVACFNVQQRDLILERLEEMAASDGEFGRRFAEARARRGAASFEGLFVKNLENVQGDERDEMIISTTYGPDANGRFYRRFGPLGMSGGGRRLNVLVTRARHEVHLVTSIPPEFYRSLPPIPAGQSPSGGWLLFAYMAYAEQLAKAYEQSEQQRVAETANGKPAEGDAAAVRAQPTKHPSAFALALANTLAARHNTGSDVHWGNDGFCVDLALHHPARRNEVTLGILCDGSRFGQAQDPVEWDIFRTAIHESQGWNLHRLWSPQFFRDPEGCISAILKQAAKVAGRDGKTRVGG